MAEIVSFVVDKLISLVAREANLLIGLHGDVETIKDELESIASFLVEADAREARGDYDELLRTWVKHVRKVACRIEDVMDEYMHHVARRRQEQGAYRFLRMADRSVRKLVTRHEIASEVEDIKDVVVEIKNRADRYGLTGSPQQQTTRSQIASLFRGEDELVGMEGPRHELLRWLEEDGEGKRMVFSVVGMGGLGKTTLARKVYDQKHIGGFDCRAWVTVSQTFLVKELLKSIIQQFYQAQGEVAPEKIETMDEVDQLIMELRAYVGQKKYLVVFDDVWSRELREDMMHALPESNSKMIFTTRSEDVAPSSAQSSLNRVYKLSLLPFEKSFELFCKKVFQAYNGGFCPPELKELSEDVVRKCDGLPLAIVTVGGVLSSKEKNISEWKKFQNSLGARLESDEQMTRVERILSLSYHDLSPNLKSCLLYFGIYPEDCSISCTRLIRQWIAEGFVKAKNNEVLEDVAEEYLSELMRRSVIQVSRVDSCNKVRTCRVHDLMREVILLKLEDAQFCSVLGENGDATSRRLSMVRNDLSDSVKVSVSLIRSLFVFQSNEFSKQFTRHLFGNLKLVRMLDFEGSGVKLLPESVGDLFHLRYLSVKATRVEKLPKSIGKLVQLETLDMRNSRVRELPVEIKRLRKLRHLLANSFDNQGLTIDLPHIHGVQVQEGLGCWETLQKLYDVEANSGTIIKDLINFSQLRKLGIGKVRSQDVLPLCKAVEKMKELQFLRITVIDEEQVLDLESIHFPPPFLQRLVLAGRLEALPSWIAKLQNLVSLHLLWSGLIEDPLGVLQNLPNLLNLTMINHAYNGDRLHFKEGFPKLKSLTFLRLKGLKHLIIKQGALPCLKALRIGPVSPQMMEVPSGIQHLTNLKRMSFFDFPKEFCMKMVPDGPSWSIIQHIPKVTFTFLNLETGKHDTFTPASYGDTKVNK